MPSRSRSRSSDRGTPASTERIAALAAQLVADGRAATVREAISTALERLNTGRSAAPGEGLVRQHLQPLLMASLGAQGYASMVEEREELVRTVMTLLAGHPGTVEVVLAGRAAKGLLDGDLVLHLRAYTRRPIGELAQVLVDAGFEEPRFSTAETRFGRRDRLEFEAVGVAVHVIRCLPEERRHAESDLFSGKRVAVRRMGPGTPGVAGEDR